MGAHSGRRVQGNEPFIGMEAIGGNVMDITIDGRAYRVHAFTDVGEHQLEVLKGGECDVLVIGGGGATTEFSGGAGAGGVVYKKIRVNKNNYDTIVGDGGLESQSITPSNFPDGEDSSIFEITAFGGGGGISSNSSDTGRSGGSGGGIGSRASNGGSGTSGQGNDGGDGYQEIPRTQSGGTNNNGGSGGGGGASEKGQNGDFREGGNGGNGIYVDWADVAGFGENGWFGGGGAGFGDARNGSAIHGTPGLGGGGLPVNGTSFNESNTDGMENTGGGAGAGGPNGRGRNGGSGIVLIRYPIPTFPVEASGGTETEYTAPNGIVYKIHSFTDVGEDTFEVTNAGGCEALIVGGGGGGGDDNAGGGGGGGVLNIILNVNENTHNIIVGNGGNPSVNRNEAQTNGGNSLAFDNIAFGGGFGAAGQLGLQPPSIGGSGGGGEGERNDPNGSAIGAQGIIGQGNKGGDGHTHVVQANGNFGGGGGGGAKSPGEDGLSNDGGSGGIGFLTDIEGTENQYGSGGAGGGPNGVGGGGGGSFLGPGQARQGTGSQGGDGQTNSGGGGGGSSGTSSRGGNGGSGVVIIRYPISKINRNITTLLTFKDDDSLDSWSNITGIGSWELLEDSQSLSNKAMIMNAGGNPSGMAINLYDSIESIEYFDVTTAIANYTPAGTNRVWGGVIYRFSENENGANWFQCEISRIGGSPHLRVRKISDHNTDNAIGNQPNDTDLISPVEISEWSGGEYWNIRTKYTSDNFLRVKYWKNGELEPENFQINILENDPPPVGKVGAIVSGNVRSDLDARWSFFRITRIFNE